MLVQGFCGVYCWPLGGWHCVAREVDNGMVNASTAYACLIVDEELDAGAEDGGEVDSSVACAGVLDTGAVQTGAVILQGSLHKCKLVSNRNRQDKLYAQR